MTQRTTLITGGNSGIGLAAAKEIAEAGHHVIISCRSQEKADKAIAEIKAASKKDHVDNIIMDLADLESVKSAAADYKNRFGSLDVLINNAGGHFEKGMKTKQGFEYTIGVNHLGHFLFTHELMDLLKASKDPRILNISSEAHKMGNMDVDDLMYEKNFNHWKAYGRAKLANIMFTYDLAEKYGSEGITTHAIHPGPINTNFWKRGTGIKRFFLEIMGAFMLSPDQGADTVVYLATVKKIPGKNGLYWKKREPLESRRVSYNKEVRDQLWKKSEELVGLRS